ncbi:MAG: isoprenylcysteine carboxylmethyltransferase family protein [Candidatus Aminicenantes bacterium]|nr:isoprenylcysteine carboxylmethyltransferase family protein [Candidatus Aminicenantes bacterium]
MKERNDEHPCGDRGQLLFLAVFLLVWIGDSFIFKISTFLTPSVPLFIRLAVLAICLILGILLSKSGHRAAEDNYRGKRVIKTGAFHYVRHPLYLASMLTYFGAAVSTLSLLSLALLIPIIIFFDTIAGYEEKYMENKFGKEYTEYRKRTGKWIPGIN